MPLASMQYCEKQATGKEGKKQKILERWPLTKSYIFSNVCYSDMLQIIFILLFPVRVDTRLFIN